MYIVLKTILTGVIVVAVSEIGKRSTWIAAILASLPLSSILALVWLYRDTHNNEAVRKLSDGIFWMVLPSLMFFLVLSYCLRIGTNFYLSLLISSTIMAVSYAGYLFLLKRIGLFS